MANDFAFINNERYYFNYYGEMQTGWIKITHVDDPYGTETVTWYYANSSGALQTGWRKINNKWYFFDDNNQMATNWTYIDGKWHDFHSNGVWDPSAKLP